MNHNYHLGYMTEFEVREILTQNPVIILPVGSSEQHGSHLPVLTDAILAERLSLEIAKEINGIVLPPINYGNSFSWKKGFVSTFTLSQGGLSDLIFDIGRQIGELNCKFFIILNGHGGNPPDIILGAKKLKEQFQDMEILMVEWWSAGATAINELKESESETHGGEFETSLMLYLAQEYVETEKYITEFAKNVPSMCFSDLIVRNSGDKIKRIQFYSTEMSMSGIYGDPTKATKEKGKKVVDRVVQNVKKTIEELRQ